MWVRAPSSTRLKPLIFYERLFICIIWQLSEPGFTRLTDYKIFLIGIQTYEV